MVEVAIIGGSGVYDPRLLTDLREESVETRYGTAQVTVGQYRGHSIAFMQRHGKGHTLPPHRINYRANIMALKQLGAKSVIATSAVGSINRAMHPGDLVLLDQFIDFTKQRPFTFFDGEDGEVVHTDFTTPYCPKLRRILLESARAKGIRIHPTGTYVCTEGPRYETPAEIRAYGILGGDVVGMTNVPEVVLANEAGLSYAVVAMVTNYGAGISPNPLSHEEVLEVMEKNGESIRILLMDALARLLGGND